MNLASILSLIVQNAPAVETTVANLVNMFRATTAPTATTVPGAPAAGDLPPTQAVTKKPSPVIRDLQNLLNKFVKMDKPLVADGWLGPKTEDAIKQALVLAKPYLSMLGG